MSSVKFQDAKLTYKIQLHFNILTINKYLKEEEETILFSILLKMIKYLGINLAKRVKDMHTEKYKTFIIEIEKDTNKRKDILFFQLGRITLIKCLQIAKVICRFKAIAMKIQQRFKQKQKEGLLKCI